MENGRKEGRGKYYYVNGAVYDGEWKSDLKDGSGIFYYASGDYYEG